MAKVLQVWVILTVFENIKEGLEGHAASWYSDVFDLVFPNIDANQANKLWKAQLAKPEKEGEQAEDDD